MSTLPLVPNDIKQNVVTKLQPPSKPAMTKVCGGVALRGRVVEQLEPGPKETDGSVRGGRAGRGLVQLLGLEPGRETVGVPGDSHPYV
jgi:hypothetical protein